MLSYFSLEYSISFSETVDWGNVPPSMVIRSVLGYQLRHLTCVLRNEPSCTDCMLNHTCVYARFFESHLNKKNEVLAGRDRASHPFSMDIFLSDDNKAVIALTVIGQARNYIPYLTIALQRAGEQGIGRKRTPFAMEKITHEGKTFDYSIENVEKKSLFWPDAIGMQNLGTIILDSPCRIKKAAHYLQTIYVDDLLLAAQRHMYILDRLYGDGRFSIQELPNHSSIPVDQHWIDQNYYSSRQHTHMKIGGVVGKIELKNSLDQYSYELLEACRLFHVGKNISMGLGRILLMRR